MRLIRPNKDELIALFGKRVRSVWICSPWISKAGVDLLRACFERCDLTTLESLELWTRLVKNDYKFGLTDYPAISRLLDEIRDKAPGVQMSIWSAPNLHAKIIWTDVGALVGSANLTSAGFTTNVEVMVRLELDECKQQASVRDVLRQGLGEVSPQQWISFISSLEDVLADVGTVSQMIPEEPSGSGTWDDLLGQLLSDGFPFDRGIR